MTENTLQLVQLDNALKYSADAIELVVSTTAQEMQVSVKDRGEAIPEENTRRYLSPTPAMTSLASAVQGWVWHCAGRSPPRMAAA